MQEHNKRASDLPAWSRTGIVSPTGTLISELKTKVDPETDLLFRRAVMESGTDVAGALRDFVFLIARGQTFTSMVADEAKVKHDRFFGKGLIEALKGGTQ